MQNSRGVFILRLFWRSGLRPNSFLRKQVFWKSAVHQLLNHSVRSRAGAAGPEWDFTLSRDQCLVWAWPERGRWPGTEGRVVRGSPPTHTLGLLLCPRTLVCRLRGRREQPFSGQSAKGIPLGAPLAGDSLGVGGRQTV